jgi:hypothetical protein
MKGVQSLLVIRMALFHQRKIQHPSADDFMRAIGETVLYMGVPYTDCKRVRGHWYFQLNTGEYQRFVLQTRIRKAPPLSVAR